MEDSNENNGVHELSLQTQDAITKNIKEENSTAAEVGTFEEEGAGISDKERKEYKPSEKWRIIKNIVVISLAFMVHFTAFQGAGNLQSSVNADEGLGTVTLATIYFALILSNVFLPVVMIR
jgi:hypothetical protein